MSRPLALDLLCGAGGVSVGLERAGFEVIGVDIRPQPRHRGGRFVQADALNPPFDLARFDFVWASPPCQEYIPQSKLKPGDLLEPTRQLLKRARLWCIENIARSPVRPDLVLDGDMFGLNTHRRRHFELNFFCLAPPPNRRFGPISRPGSVTVVGRPGGTSWRMKDGRGRRMPHGLIAQWRDAMGIDWMIGREIKNAIPPAYAEFIGRAAIARLGARGAAA